MAKKAAAASSTSKTSADSETIDAYISGFPAEVQRILQKIRQIIHQAAPEATEAMKYRIPTFVLGGNLVHFAAFAKHIGFYPAPSGIAHFQNELSAYPNAKGSVQFPLDRPIPYELIQRIVEFRVQETEAKRKPAKQPKATPIAKAAKSSRKKRAE